MTPNCSLHFPEPLYRQLHAHLFPGDHQEHAAVILAGLAQHDGRVRLLARELYLAVDGVDHVVGPNGLLTTRASFIRPLIRRAGAERLVYIGVHNHGGDRHVAFSPEDLDSHARGYPTLLDLAEGMPVAALVLARHAVAGEVWFPDATRASLAEARVAGAVMRRLYPEPPEISAQFSLQFDRQVQMFGAVGQARLRSTRATVIGAGGVGSLLVQMLAHLGVGCIRVIDPDRIDESNLSRVVGATMKDVTGPRWRWPWSREQFPRLKIDIAGDVARAANPQVDFRGIAQDFSMQSVAQQVLDSDVLFLAADDMRARLVFNAIVQQYYIPGLQIGSIVVPDKQAQLLESVFTVNRWVLPGTGCLWCSGAIDRHRLAIGAKTDEERRDQDYGSGTKNPSVITLNALGAAMATNDFLFSFLELFAQEVVARPRRMHHLNRRVQDEQLTPDPLCSECSNSATSRFGRGDAAGLPTFDG